MKPHSPFMQAYDQLPDTLPVFPLPNAVILPVGYLPLNIFEPRYLNMLEDAMSSHRLIGMIQPRDDNPQPALYQVGCAGRVSRYEETRDGRLEIMLSGLCRFAIKQEITTTRGYRLIIPDWSNFSSDYEEQQQPDPQSTLSFNGMVRSYFKQNNMDADWGLLEKLSVEELVNSLINYLPLSIEDKQMLIETDTLVNRITVFTAILESDSTESGVKH